MGFSYLLASSLGHIIRRSSHEDELLYTYYTPFSLSKDCCYATAGAVEDGETSD